MTDDYILENINIKSKLADYDVIFINDFDEHIKSYGDKSAYIIDRKVYNLYKDSFYDIDSNKIFMVDAVEENKDMSTVMDCIEFMFKLGVRKDWTVCAVGGGITQDISTLACDLYLRNVNWVYYPTTLLSMSDSCIGGKSGINYKSMKNQIGVFYPPMHIYIDTRFIDTLTRDDYLNGWGELVKFSLTDNIDFYNSVKNEKSYIPCEHIAEYLHMGLCVKKTRIEEDEFDTGVRRLLNYGHTFGHALEAYTNNEIPHGKGVLWGMDVANYIAWKRGMIEESYYLDIKNLICNVLLKNEIEVSKPERLFDILKTDKKVKGNSINFALLNGYSNLVIETIELNKELLKIFKEYLEYTHKYFDEIYKRG